MKNWALDLERILGGFWEGLGKVLGRFWEGFGRTKKRKREKKERQKESEKKKEKREGREGGRPQLSILALRRYLYKGRLPWKPPLLKLGTVGHQFEVSPVYCEEV